MENHIYLLLLPILLLITFDSTAKPNQKKKQIKFVQNVEIEKHLGRKLKLTEKISLKLINKKLSKKVTKQRDQPFDLFSIAGLVSGIASVLSLLLGGIVASIIFGVLAIVFGAIGMKRTQDLKGFRKKGKGLAIAGLVIGIIATVFWTLVFIALTNLAV